MNVEQKKVFFASFGTFYGEKRNNCSKFVEVVTFLELELELELERTLAERNEERN